MNSDILKGKWNQMTGELKSKWGQLTDNDWTEINGDKDRLVGKIQERYGKAKDAVSREVDEFFQRHNQTTNTGNTGTGNTGTTGQRGNQGTQTNPTTQPGDRNRKVS